MSGGDDITLGEVVRRLDRMERAFETARKDLSHQIDGLQFVHRDTYEVEKQSDRARLDTIEERLRFYGRSLFVSLALPVVVALILAVVLTR